jgi:hypothetical protein
MHPACLEIVVIVIVAGYLFSLAFLNFSTEKWDILS